MTLGDRKRVAVIGAAGIGKHHAKWWILEGAEVCAVAGTSIESAERAAEGLRAICPFDGRAYGDVTEMLERERPDIVDVCSPPACHAAHVRTALAAGCDVLCEKPFVYRPEAPSDALRAEARALVSIAETVGRRLALCVQYAEGARVFHHLWRDRFPDEPLERVQCHLEAPAKGRPADPVRVWVDLAPHPLSVVQSLLPDGRLDPASLETAFDGYTASARFLCEPGSGPPVMCELLTRNSVDPPRNLRQFRFNDYAIKVEGGTDEEGNYCSIIETPDGTRHAPDMMRLTIRRFLEGRPTVEGPGALRNTDWLLRILDAAREAQGRALYTVE